MEWGGSILVFGFLKNGTGENQVVTWHAATAHAGTLATQACRHRQRRQALPLGGNL
jgi:hypothetical protein